jgi:hypothetical protein
MGMYDYVHCEVPLPDGYVGDMQTKDFDCFFGTILIRTDGRLLVEEGDWEAVPLDEQPNPKIPMFGTFRVTNKRWRDLDFHGDFRFHGSRDRGDWHEYLARFTHGVLETIIAIPETFSSQANVIGGISRVLEAETRAASVYADRVIAGAEGKLTLGRRLDEIIAVLPEEDRRAVESQATALIAEASGRLSRR